MNNILSNWNLLRLLRLSLGIFIIVQGVQDGIWMFALLGGLFALLAVLNVGCCGLGSCAPPVRKAGREPKETTYEEIL